MTEMAVASCAQKPTTKFSLMTFLPTVSMTLIPRRRRPEAIPRLPIQYPDLDEKLSLPLLSALAYWTTRRGEIALATSLDPCDRHTRKAAITIM